MTVMYHPQRRLRAKRALPPWLRARAARASMVDSCGCGTGAAFLAAALLVSGLWYAWAWYTATISAGAAVLRVFLWAFSAAIVGKIVGMLGFRIRALRARSLALGPQTQA